MSLCVVLKFSVSVDMFKIKIIDLLNFIPMRLADFLDTFGLTELAKGYFPHHFNKKGNQHYVGPLPDKSYYDMSQKEISTMV